MIVVVRILVRGDVAADGRIEVSLCIPKGFVISRQLSVDEVDGRWLQVDLGNRPFHCAHIYQARMRKAVPKGWS